MVQAYRILKSLMPRLTEIVKGWLSSVAVVELVHKLQKVFFSVHYVKQLNIITIFQQAGHFVETSVFV